MAQALKIRVGADPELFVRERSTGKLVSAHDLIPGTKEKPFKVMQGAIQVDGCAAEFNIDPAQDCATFVNNIQTVMNELKGRLGDKYEFCIEPTAMFDKPYFDDVVPFSAKLLGCDPDWNAWTGEVNPRPDNDTSMRTAAGHVHIGWLDSNEFADPWDPVHQEDCKIVGKTLDYFLGVPSLLFDPDWTRRQMYGKAGAIRFKPYGVEYRTLSNAWLKSPELIQWVFNTTQHAMQRLIQQGYRADEKFGNAARKTIDENEADFIENPRHPLHKIFGELGLYMPPIPNHKPIDKSKLTGYQKSFYEIYGRLPPENR